MQVGISQFHQDTVSQLAKQLASAPLYTETRLEHRTEIHLKIPSDYSILNISEDVGGYLRARAGNIWHFESLSGVHQLPEYLQAFIQYARQYDAVPPPDLPPVHYHEDALSWIPDAHHFHETLQGYSHYIKQYPHIHHVQVNAFAVILRTLFMNSAGSMIEQVKPFFYALFAIIAEGGTPQTAFTCLSGTTAEALTGHEPRLLQAAEIAYRQTSAKPIKQGQYTVILDSAMTGVFIHEGFGHLREADNLSAGLGSSLHAYRMGDVSLNIVDDPTLDDMVGGYAYDDEGTAAQKTVLVQDGYLVGRLHTISTAARWKEPPTGHARTVSYLHPPMPRMSCTYMAAGNTPHGQLFDGIQTGLYVRGSRGGSTNGQVFTFVPEEAWMIRHGQLAEPVRNVVLTGEIFKTLQSIEAIGDEFDWSPAVGCWKRQQFLPTVNWGGPAIRISRVMVGGTV
jgi:TldD protein